MPFTVGIFLFDDVEVLDFAGPYEVFTIDMSLHLVQRLAGHALALATARQMDFEWTSEPQH